MIMVSEPPQDVPPVGGVDYPRTYPEFREWFPDEASCVEYLERLRWPEGFVCPVCAATGGWRIAGGQWMCSVCGRKTSVNCWDDLSSNAQPVVELVCRGVVRDVDEERGVGSGSAAGDGVRLV